MKTATKDIVISGGGIPGVALALLLAQKGMDVAVIEPFPPETLSKTVQSGRTSALMTGSLEILQKTGAWQRCEQYGAPLKTLRIIDENGTHPNAQTVQADFTADEIGKNHFGINIPNNILRAALYDQARENSNISLIEGDKLSGIETGDSKICIKTANNKTITASLLVGADGRQSKVRELTGIGSWQKDYKQSAITCLFRHSLSHHNISTEFHRPGGPFTLVPLPDNVSSLVWVEKTSDSERFTSMSQHAFTRALQDRTRDKLGEIELLTAPQSCPLMAIRAKKLTGSRTAIIAEAAHVIHPLGAQGLNLSLRDTACLAHVINETAALGLDIGSRNMLERYAEKRRNDIFLRFAATHGLNKLVSTNIGLAHQLRRSGLKAISNVPALKEMIMRQGLSA